MIMKARASTVFLILVSSVISFPLKAIAETILENELKLYLQPIQNYAYACHYDTAARISLVGKISGKILTAGQRWTKIDAAAQLKKLRQRFKNASSGKAKARKNLKNFKAIIKGCSSFHATAGPGDPGGPPIPTPTPTVIINPPTGEFVGVEGLLVPYREALTSAEASYVACKFALCSPRHRQIAEVQGLTAFANA
ncbi:MAG: hypothetical protein DCC75_03265, partial [Proteobacteria bacterium]